MLGVAAHWIGSRLSSDAIGIVLGLVFGIMAAVPSGLLMYSAGRRDARLGNDRPAAPPPPVNVVIIQQAVILPGSAEFDKLLAAAGGRYVSGVPLLEGREVEAFAADD
jgi:hypothetical protein